MDTCRLGPARSPPRVRRAASLSRTSQTDVPGVRRGMARRPATRSARATPTLIEHQVTERLASPHDRVSRDRVDEVCRTAFLAAGVGGPTPIVTTMSKKIILGTVVG
jgi:hypothetical protein